MSMLLAIGLIAIAGYFSWVVAVALIRGRTPDFGRDTYRSEQPGKYWVQVILCSWMALGATISALFVIGDVLNL